MVNRAWGPVVDQHATCIAVNPVQGCPNGCLYCFLNERDLTRVKPEQLADPETTLRTLLESPFYSPSRVLALYTWTDVMATRMGHDHVIRLLQLMADSKLPNAVTLITKCHIPDRVLDALAAARSAGLRLIVYLSYSGLGPDVEQGILHAKLRDNFPRLAARGVPIIHYWRPVFPASATDEVMEGVLRHAVAYARCSIVAGLKVEHAARERLATIWPALLTHAEAETAEGVFPARFWRFVHTPPEWAHEYPIFHTNSCALAYVLGESDKLAIYGTSVCLEHNRCPINQRTRCSAAQRALGDLTVSRVSAALQKFGCEDLTFTIDAPNRHVHIGAPLPTNVVSALTQELVAIVSAPRDPDDYYWNSGTAGATPLILE